MSFETQTQHFDVIGPGYIPERHIDEKHRHLSEMDGNVVGGAMAWLAFYSVAVVAVIAGHFHKAAGTVVAAVN